LAITISGMQPLSEKKAAESTLETTLDVYWERIYRVIFRIVGDQAEAEDLALETFWRLHLEHPHNQENLAGWLYRVATHLSLNVLRSRYRRRFYEQRATDETYFGTSVKDPAQEAERSEERQQVRQVFTQMKARDVQILVLRYSGLSYAEIAAALHIKPGSVGKLLARAEADFERKYRTLERGE
jgi:RNA polymerase sigma-70 factor, ECF subfamily